jgi:hypothetical protein
MRKLLIGFLFALTAADARAAPLKVVNVAAPAINCVFTTAAPCTIGVSDSSADVPMSAGGTGRLQSRTFAGKAGSPAPGLFAYEYRLNLTDAVGTAKIACIDWMTISFGPVVNTLDYDRDQKTDQFLS